MSLCFPETTINEPPLFNVSLKYHVDALHSSLLYSRGSYDLENLGGSHAVKQRLMAALGSFPSLTGVRE